MPSIIDAHITDTYIPNTLLTLAIFLSLAILAIIANKIKQPTVLGQIVLGCLLSVFIHYKIPFFVNLLHNQVVVFLAELGSIFLLFEIGLESEISAIISSGKHAILIALFGALMPFLLGYFIVTPLVLHTHGGIAALFIAAMLAVTSTGVSISVFKELKVIRNPACQIVLTASIIDDIIGLILLATTTSIINMSTVAIHSTIISIVVKSLIFALVVFLIAKLILPFLINHLLSRISNDHNMLLLILVVTACLISWGTYIVNLSSLVGAFIAGLILHSRFFSNYRLGNIQLHVASSVAIDKRHLVMLISPFATVFIPIFFIYSGMHVDIIAACNWHTLIDALIITAAAIVGKLCCAILVPKGTNRWIVAIGMIPRGEIGLIFANTGLTLHIIDNRTFTAILFMILLTSIITPIILNLIIKDIN